MSASQSFRVCARIAAGGMGEGWTGEHCATGMRVAPRTLRPEPAPAMDPSAWRQCARDGDLMRAIRRAVAEEDYMTLIVPDDAPADWASRGTPASAAVVAVRR